MTPIIPIILLLTFIAVFLLQEKYFKNKKNYKNKMVKIYQDIKIPIFISSIVILIYIIITEKNKTDDTTPELFMKQPCF